MRRYGTRVRGSEAQAVDVDFGRVGMDLDNVALEQRPCADELSCEQRRRPSVHRLWFGQLLKAPLVHQSY